MPVTRAKWSSASSSGPTSPGSITGIRYYKSAANSGTHTGSLWSESGARLATATFANETATGWQVVLFQTPVAVSANTTYVASYHTTTGHYAATAGYFLVGLDSPPLHALSNGTSPNGVYQYRRELVPELELQLDQLLG